MVLAKPAALAYWNKLIGPSDPKEARATLPHTLRALYGSDPIRNAFHSSSDFKAAEREIYFFFPQIPSETLLTEQTALKEFLTSKFDPNRISTKAQKSLQDVLVCLCCLFSVRSPSVCSFCLSIYVSLSLYPLSSSSFLFFYLSIHSSLFFFSRSV
jgi:hypothetical protein